MDQKQFAAWVLAAMAAHENSFDRTASEAASEAASAERARRKEANDPTYVYCVVDHEQFYRMTQRQAVESVVPAAWVEPVYLLMVTAWNDIETWCREVKEAA